MSGKYGIPYFANFIGSDLRPDDVRSMCPLTTDTKIMIRTSKGISIQEIGDIYQSQVQGETEFEVWTGKRWERARLNRQSKTKIFKITLSNGNSVKMGENHLQPVRGKGTLKASEIQVGDFLPYNKNVIDVDYELGSYDLGYAVGAYAGDGSHNQKTLIYSLCSNGKDEETKERLSKFWKENGFEVKVSEGERNVLFVRVLGNAYDIIQRYLSGDTALTKAITKKTLNMSPAFKEGFLDGFRATDGSRDKKRLYTSSLQLKEDLMALFNSLGKKSLSRWVDTREGRLGKNPNYRVDFPGRSSYGAYYSEDKNYHYYSVTEIEEVQTKSDYLYCFEVDNTEHLFMLADGLITHNCRLRLDLSELRRKNGGLFGSGDSTGSVSVTTLNLPRIGYESQTEEEFFKILSERLELAKKASEQRRAWLQANVIEKNLIPAFMTYVGTIDNHFSTIGIVGMNEMCENFLGVGIDTPEGKEFALKVGDFIRTKIQAFQEETGHLYNYEATPKFCGPLAA